MAIYHRNVEKRRILQDFRRHEEEVIGSLCRLSNRPVSPKSQMEQERRIRREIANSNERRRMQSINAGFQSLRALLPHHEGEKLSKAAILQQTTQYIYQIEQEKTRLLSQNCQLKRLLNQQNQDSDGGSSSDSPLPKRKKGDLDSVDEGIGNVVCEPAQGELKREMVELRMQLERERKLRMIYEEQTRNLETQLYPERIRENEQLQYDQSPEEYGDEDEDDGPRAEGSPRRTADDNKDASSSVMSLDGDLLPEDSPHPSLFSVSSKENRVPSIGQQLKHDEVIVAVRSKNNSGDDDEMVHDDDVVDVHLSKIPYQSSPPPQSPPQVVPALQQQQQQSQLRVYFPSTSRQNLETIVEAIRHLEGDHLFSDDPLPSSLSTESKREEESSTAVVVGSATDLSYRQHRTHQHHPHVIQMTSTAPPTRPGVIVSAHS